MADVKQAKKYDYMKPEDRKKICEPAGQNDNNFGICAIAVQEVIQDKDNKPKTKITSAVKRDSILSTDLTEGMVIKVESSKDIEQNTTAKKLKKSGNEVEHNEK